MSPSVLSGTTPAHNIPDFRTRLMRWALVISLLLHGGAALVVVYLGAFTTVGKHSSNITIQEIELSPSLTAPSPPLAAPPEMVEPSPSPLPEVEKLLLEPPAAIQPQPPVSENAEKEGGLISTPLGLGMTHGYFSMLADGKSLREDIRAYYFVMVEKINREWWDKASLLKEPLREDGAFEISIQRDGVIESLRLLRGTGSKEADRLIADIIRKASPLPPLPSTYDSDLFRVPIKVKAPLILFRSKN